MKQNVFVSKPNGLNDRQERFWDAIEATVEARNMNIRSIGYSDYSFKTPLQNVREVMRECDGAVILGFSRNSTDGYSEHNSRRIAQNAGQVNRFALEMEEGHLVLSSDKTEREYLIGEVTSGYE